MDFQSHSMAQAVQEILAIARIVYDLSRHFVHFLGLHPDLESLELEKLERLIASSTASQSVGTLETLDGEQVEISVE